MRTREPKLATPSPAIGAFECPWLQHNVFMPHGNQWDERSQWKLERLEHRTDHGAALVAKGGAKLLHTTDACGQAILEGADARHQPTLQVIEASAPRRGESG